MSERTRVGLRLPPIGELNAVDEATFTEALRPLFERAPACAGRLHRARPFASYEDLLDRALAIVHALPERERIAILDAHPRIGESPKRLSERSRAEQGRAGVERPEDVARIDRELAELNAAYESRFGFRCVVFVAGRSRAAIAGVIRERLGNERDAELASGIDAFLAIADDRLRRSR